MQYEPSGARPVLPAGSHHVAHQLTDEDFNRIDELSAPGQMIVPFYEADFGPDQFMW